MARTEGVLTGSWHPTIGSRHRHPGRSQMLPSSDLPHVLAASRLLVTADWSGRERCFICLVEGGLYGRQGF